uniref:Uncharacterized protein n=1 Tax=Avena sativa TaxID=4498 RepID=A0ACD5WX72_AVESA
MDMVAFYANIEVDDDDDDAPVDVNAFVNTGASKGPFMPPLIEEPSFHNQASHPKKRLVFRGFSQETPPAAEIQPPSAGIIFSPDTLRRTAGDGLASLVEAADAKRKRVRKRPNRNKDKATSQPAPIRYRDDVVPPREDGLTRVHEAGQPILPPELRRLASGAMMSLHERVLTLEGLLLKDKDPSYPVFTAKVPEDVGFITDALADVFFIAYEDIFKLFHLRRLDYNLVRLFALNLVMKVKREDTPFVAIADPYYMRDSQLEEGIRTRARAKSYLQKLLMDNKRKDNILVPFFPEDKYCTLIMLSTRYSLATYFDSGSARRKNYARGEAYRDDGRHKFKHVFEFPCVKQPSDSVKEAIYVCHHLKGFVRDCEMLTLPSSLQGWAQKLHGISDPDLREDFHDTQVKLSHIIMEQVNTHGGLLHQPRSFTKREIEARLKAQGDFRTWTTKDMYKPFPAPCEEKAT